MSGLFSESDRAAGWHGGTTPVPSDPAAVTAEPSQPTPHWSAPGGPPPDVESRLDALERLVAGAKTVPMSSSILLNRAEVEGLLAELRQRLPEALRQARHVLRERDGIIEQARREAGEVLEEAQRDRSRMLSRTEVVQAANREADRLIGEAEEHARRIRLEAEDYVDAKLANFEVVLSKILAAVGRGRQKLRGRIDADELAEQAPGRDTGDE